MNEVACSRIILVLMQRFTKITVSVLLSYISENEVPFRHIQLVKTVLKKELFVGKIELVHPYFITIAVPLQPRILSVVVSIVVHTDRTGGFLSVRSTLRYNDKLNLFHIIISYLY
jgi:hypothetical protein